MRYTRFRPNLFFLTFKNVLIWNDTTFRTCSETIFYISLERGNYPPSPLISRYKLSYESKKFPAIVAHPLPPPTPFHHQKEYYSKNMLIFQSMLLILNHFCKNIIFLSIEMRSWMLHVHRESETYAKKKDFLYFLLSKIIF